MCSKHLNVNKAKAKSNNETEVRDGEKMRQKMRERKKERKKERWSEGR
jgi:hypothetical protein